MNYIPTGNITDNGFTIQTVNRIGTLKVVAKLSGQDKVSKSPFETIYATADAWTNSIQISGAKLKDLNNPVLDFTVTSVKNQLGFITEKSDWTRSKVYWFEVEVSTKTRTLNKNQQTLKGTVRRDNYDYFIMHKKKKEDALVLLHVLEGEADLYIMKGIEKFPDTNSYTYKSASVHDDEILVPVTDHKSGDIEEYSIGVFGTDNSKYTITLLRNSKNKLYKVEPGQIISKRLKAGESLLLVLDLYESV